jgi:hypothetical protein
LGECHRDRRQPTTPGEDIAELDRQSRHVCSQRGESLGLQMHAEEADESMRNNRLSTVTGSQRRLARIRRPKRTLRDR